MKSSLIVWELILKVSTHRSPGEVMPHSIYRLVLCHRELKKGGSLLMKALSLDLPAALPSQERLVKLGCPRSPEGEAGGGTAGGGATGRVEAQRRVEARCGGWSRYGAGECAVRRAEKARDGWRHCGRWRHCESGGVGPTDGVTAAGLGGATGHVESQRRVEARCFWWSC